MNASHTVILTGAASGVGHATAERLLADGVRVVAVDVREPTSNVTEFHPCDLGDPGSIKTLTASLDGQYDALLNVAGVPGTVGAELTMRVNLLGLRMFTEGVWEQLVDGARVVNVASVAGNNWRRRREALNELLATGDFDAGLAWWQAHGDRLEIDAYTFSKEAVVLYTMQLAGRGLARGIRVNDVGPGPIDTPILPDFTRAAGAEMMKQMINMVGRPAAADDIAEAICALASGHMKWLNGHHLVLDGGMMAGYSAGWGRS